jgi:hypothetical protein
VALIPSRAQNGSIYLQRPMSRQSPAPISAKGDSPGGPLGWIEGGGLTVLLVVALLVGLQLGGVPWRYRKQLWQLQGGVVGALVGYGMGRWMKHSGGRKP